MLREYTWSDDSFLVAQNPNYRYLPAVVLHELGHTPGLGHSGSGNNVMYGPYNTQMRPQRDDREAMRANYAGHSPH